MWHCNARMALLRAAASCPEMELPGCLDDGDHLCSHLRPCYTGPDTSHRPQPI